jgi:hypothetical protein
MINNAELNRGKILILTSFIEAAKIFERYNRFNNAANAY